MASALVLIFCAGILVQAYVLRQIFAWFDLLLERIPGETLYTSTRDLLHFMAGNKNSELQKVVLVTLDSAMCACWGLSPRGCEPRQPDQPFGCLRIYPRPTKLVALQCTCRKSAASFGHKP